MDMEAYVDTQCSLLGITLSPEKRTGVVRYMQLVASMAPRVMDFAAQLGPAHESGNVFRPVSPPTEPGAGS